MNLFKGNDKRAVIVILALVLFFFGIDKAIEQYFGNFPFYYYIVAGVILAMIFKIKIR